MILPPMREVLAVHDLKARRCLGQNFLFDLNLTGRIARSCGDLSQGTTLEIGPGPGGLTRALLDAGARRVIAIEYDERMYPIQEEIAKAYPGRLDLLRADALDLELATLGEAPRRICANLPYNIGTVLLVRMLARIEAFETIVIMLQKEVVDRLCASPGTKEYGRLSVLAQWLCVVEPLFDVNPRAFIPPPKVTSTVVRLTPRPVPLAEASFSCLEQVTATAFNQRRKMLRQSLKPLTKRLATGETPETVCAALKIDPTARAETLRVEDFCALACFLDRNAPVQRLETG